MSRRREFVVPALELDREAAAPLSRQIRDQIAGAIRDGAIPAGAWLPSSRLLARLLGVSRNTALAAYDDLVADALVGGVPGAGMQVLPGARFPGPASLSLRHLLQAAAYPARILDIADPDGNRLYLRY